MNTPPRPCHVSTCPQLVTPARPCPKHPRAPRFYPSPGRGSTRSWRVRRAFLLREEPYCRACRAEGVTTFAVEADHIVPLHRGGTDEWTNLQPLCAAHHASKTARDAALARVQP